VEIVSNNPYLVLMINFHLFYAGIDYVKVLLKSHQQLPHTSPLLVPSKVSQIKVVHYFQRYEASIRDIPNHPLTLVNYVECLSCHLWYLRNGTIMNQFTSAHHAK
jgi:hypothetical protein